MERAKVFIASSRRHIDIANATKNHLEGEHDVRVWDETTFGSGEYTLESLLKEVGVSDFGVFTFAPDDIVTTSSGNASAVRDNVVFELGLFMGRLGRERCAVIVPNVDDFKQISDLKGVTCHRYQYKEDADYEYYKSATKIVAQEILTQIRKVGSRLSLRSNSNALLNFLGTQPGKRSAIFYHCETLHKYYKWHVDPTPRTLEISLQSNTKDCTYEMVQTESDDLSGLQSRASEFDTVFIVDSPPYNRLCEDIVTHGRTYLTGLTIESRVRRSEDGKTVVAQEIMTSGNSATFGSDKKPDPSGENAFGDYYDHFVIMRLPAIPTISANKNNRLSLIWVIYGLHTKGTHAGLSIFRKGQVEELLRTVQNKFGCVENPYFEMVFRIPRSPAIVNNFNELELVHSSYLRTKADMALQDATPFGTALYFSKDHPEYELADVPLDTVHLDICSGCNYSCPTCIEDASRKSRRLLSLVKIIGILCDLKNAGCSHVNFYGGEPTLHPDFVPINNLTQTLGFGSLLVTNGSQLAREDIRDSLARSQNLHIRVSIDACSNETHQKNHGLTVGAYDSIRDAVCSLLQQVKRLGSNVSVSISCLLHKNLFESLGIMDAIKEWREIGVVSFHLRPIAGPNNAPVVNTIKVNRYNIRSLLSNYADFVVVPDWVNEIVKSDSANITISQKKAFDKCYSSFYRVVISPSLDGEVIGKVACAGVEMSVTNEAWISQCSYRRFDEGSGQPYPDDFRKWLRSSRIEKAVSINPSDKSSFCSKVMCCRYHPNMQVWQEVLSALSMGDLATPYASQLSL